jgi:hypothetical protein
MPKATRGSNRPVIDRGRSGFRRAAIVPQAREGKRWSIVVERETMGVLRGFVSAYWQNKVAVAPGIPQRAMTELSLAVVAHADDGDWLIGSVLAACR